MNGTIMPLLVQEPMFDIRADEAFISRVLSSFHRFLNRSGYGVTALLKCPVSDLV